MQPDFATFLPILVIGLVLLALAVWLLIRANRKTTVVKKESEPGDVLDENASPAKRNHALIDAPAAVANNFGETSAKANTASLATVTAKVAEETGALSEPEERQLRPKREVDADAPKGPPPSPKLVVEGETIDDLSRMKGVGPKLVAVLKEKGITTFAEIASWSEADIDRVDAQLGRFQGRIRRDRWTEQAKLLAADDNQGFAKKFGNQS